MTKGGVPVRIRVPIMQWPSKWGPPVVHTRFLWNRLQAPAVRWGHRLEAQLNSGLPVWLSLTL